MTDEEKTREQIEEIVNNVDEPVKEEPVNEEPVKEEPVKEEVKPKAKRASRAKPKVKIVKESVEKPEPVEVEEKPEPVVEVVEEKPKK